MKYHKWININCAFMDATKDGLIALNGSGGIHVAAEVLIEIPGRLHFESRNCSEYPIKVIKLCENTDFYALLTLQEVDQLIDKHLKADIEREQDEISM